MAKDDGISRRNFVGGAAAGALFTIVPRSVLGGSGGTAPSEKLNIAGIGVGGRGFGDLRNMESENIVALCDVDHGYADRVFTHFSDAKKYKDYRRMLDEQDDIDAVMIATPDHTHAVIAMAAIEAGKHVYCEKPLTHDVREARALAEAAEEHDVCTQMGIQGHSMEGARLVREWLQAGVIGEVRKVEAWCDLSYYPAGHAYWSPPILRTPEKGMQKPDGLDWDIWLGPQAMRPFHRAYHPGCWRAWWDFGNGMMGDRGVHTLDPVVWALDLGLPTSIGARSMGLNPDTHPLASIVTFEFPARNDMPPVEIVWYDGLRPPRPAELEPDRIMGDKQGGTLFRGSEGLLTCGIYGSGPRLIPESKNKEFLKNPPKKTIPRVRISHQQDWVQACKEGRKPGAHFGYGSQVTEICVLGNIAKRVDDRIEWDADAMKVTNVSEANKYVACEYRDGWSL